MIGHEEEATRHEGDHVARGFLGGGDEGIQPEPVNKDLLQRFRNIPQLRKTFFVFSWLMLSKPTQSSKFCDTSRHSPKSSHVTCSFERF